MNTISAEDIERRGIGALDDLLEGGPVHVTKNKRPTYAAPGGQILFPAGTYVVGSPLVFGDGANPFEAVVVQGSGNSDTRTKGTLILWLGNTPTNSVLKLRASQFCEFRDFAILAGTTAAIGMEVTTAGALAAFRNRVSNVTISGADQRPLHSYDVRLGTALRVGPEVGGLQVDHSVYELMSLVHCQTGLHQYGTQVPNNTYRDILFQNCTVIGVDFEGSDVKMENCSFAPYPPPVFAPQPPSPIADVQVRSTALWAHFNNNYHEAVQSELNPALKTGPCYLFPNVPGRSTPTTMVNCRVQWHQTGGGNVVDFHHTGALNMIGCVFLGFDAASSGWVNVDVPGGGSPAPILSMGCAYGNGVGLRCSGNSYLLDMDNAAGNGYNNSNGNVRLLQNALFLDGGGIVLRKSDGTGGGRLKLAPGLSTIQTLNSDDFVVASIKLMDPGKGEFVAFGDGVFAGGYRQTVDGWYLDNVPGTQANVPLSRLGVGAAVPTLWVAPRPGSLTAVCVTSTEARTTGTLTVEVIKQPGGIGSNLTAVLDGTNTTFKASTMNKDTFTFNAGESLTVWATTVGWTPTTADIRVSIEVET